MKLSIDQQQASDAILAWAVTGGGAIFTMGGYAGCGKTTVLGYLAAEFEKRSMLVAYATFTGRASGILSRKLLDAGVETSSRQKPGLHVRDFDYDRFHLEPDEYGMAFCGTLHRLLYQPIINDKTDELIGWRKRSELDRKYALLVVDEASMVGDTMLEDLTMHGVSILAVGDHGQLSPVGDSGELMKNPMVRLEKIHRQAEGNPIIALSRMIRETGTFPRNWATTGPTAMTVKLPVDTHNTVTYDKRSDVGEVYKKALEGKGTLSVGALCWTNKTRVSINRVVRTALGRRGPPGAGEPLICLRNTSEGIYNGMRGMLTAESEPQAWKLMADVSFPFEDIHGRYELCGYQFNRERTIGSIDDVARYGLGITKMGQLGMLFDFAYCATVHKFQGSQLEHAILIAERPQNGDEESRRFYYTAVTRASERLTILT